MSTPDLKPILDALAAGEIDAVEAARRIEAAKNTASNEPAESIVDAEIVVSEPAQPRAAGEPSNERLAESGGAQSTSTWQAPPFSEGLELLDEVPPSQRRVPREAKGIDRISVHAVGRRVRIIGDYSVATVVAEGPHVLRRNGSVLEISSDGEIGPSLDGFSMLRPPRSLDDLRSMSLGKELFLRVNPGVIVDAEVTAGSLTCDKVAYLGKIRVTAGATKITGVAEINDALIQAGQASISGSIRTGRSRLRVESGNANITLDEQSNVTVRAEAQLGRIHWVGQPQMDEMVLGNGSARFDIGVVMGNANIDLGVRE